MKKPTINDVAERAGVSTATVSAVLNHRNTVKDSTRRTVMLAVRDLNYRPSAAARRRLQPSTEKSIGLIIKEMHNTYFADVMVGAQEAARAQGYNVLVGTSERAFETEHDLVELLAAKDVEGLIINPLLDDEADLSHIFELKRRNIPFVLLESVRGLQASLVDVDNVAASKGAVQYLIDHGHTRIVHFGGPKYSMHSDERIEGVRRAFSASHLVLQDHDVVHAGARIEDGYRNGLEFFRGHSERDRPTAVTCYNDLVAVGLMKALRELDLCVPGDVSVIGYDDIDLAAYAPVPLTTVKVPKAEMGKTAAEILIRHIESSDGVVNEKVCLKTELVVRASTAAAKKPAVRSMARAD